MDPDREHDEHPPVSGPLSAFAPAESAAGLRAPADEAASPPDAHAAELDSAEPRVATELDPADTLSPAVRRLVRQYDLDVTGIHGTGPAGKIRVGDVIGMLGGRAAEPSARPNEAARGAPTPAAPDAAGEAPARQIGDSGPTTTVFECDLSRVLSHRKHERRSDAEILLTSYFVAACVEAVHVVPDVATDPVDPVRPEGAERVDSLRLGVQLATADGGLRRTLVVPAGGSLDERLRSSDAQLRATGDDDLHAAQLLIHHYGPSGSLLATPTELGAGHAASVGIGRVRREVVVKAVDGEEAPRVAARCYVTLTFRPQRVALARANQFVATLVRVLEQWPAEPMSA